MYLLFEEAGKFLAGRVLSQADASAQVELDSGKRVKVKAAQMLLQFERPAPAELLARATEMSQTIDLDLAWECAGTDEFGFADLARDYFSAEGATEQAAALLRLHEAPHYFRRAGRGRFKKAPAEVLAQALAAIEKRRLQQQQIEQWAAQLQAGQCPPEIDTQLYRLLFKPDKNAPEYKALALACRASQLAPLALLQQAGAIRSAWDFHWQRFLFEFFPKGTGFPALQAPIPADTLALAPVRAFSIDDSHTTEIDDALSLQGLGTGTVTLGIHIAAPGLALTPGDAIDQVARQRLSTVYMPGHKITMLPDEVVQRYTLQEGQDCPALSLYVQIDEATLTVQESQTRVERVPIAANLRHDQLDQLITPEWLQATTAADVAGVSHAELAFLWRLAQALKARREEVRGKPETFNRPDYTFRLDRAPSEAPPSGDETVLIGTRQRGAPLDLIVAEAMILANSTWGQWLAQLGVPGIYRSQASLAPGVKVRMGTRALPHAGIGVPSYAWSTSPLRRYADLVNQWQLLACARHGATAALAAPFKPKDTALLAIISAFDAAYTGYAQVQSGMERFWTLRHVQQQGLQTLDAALIKEMPGGSWLARAETLPLVLPVMGAAGLARGTRVRVQLGQIDLMALEVAGTVAAVLQDGAGTGDEAEEEEEVASGALQVAVTLDDTDAAGASSAAAGAGAA